MRSIIKIIGAAFILTASPHWFVEPYPDLIEIEKQLVTGCNFLGLVAETADAANPISLSAETNMVLRVRERAGQLGVTHIVWLHKTAAMATAEAYQCLP